MNTVNKILLFTLYLPLKNLNYNGTYLISINNIQKNIPLVKALNISKNILVLIYKE